MKKKIHRTVFICIAACVVMTGFISCLWSDRFYAMWRLVRWDTAEVYVINFKDQPITVELEGSDGKRTITVEPCDQESENHWFRFILSDPETGKMNLADHRWDLPYDTSELEPVATYLHTEGPESLTSIRILDGKSLLRDIPFDGSQAEEEMVFSKSYYYPLDKDILGWLGGGGIYACLWKTSPRNFLSFQEPAGIKMIVTWERAESFGDAKIDVPEEKNTFSERVERFADLTNPKIYILVGEGAYRGHAGPAGGMVFYENPNWEADGWRYLEAAPEDWYEGESDSLPWGGRGISVGETDFGVGTGKENTQTIITFWEVWRQHRLNNPNHSDDYTEGFNYSAEAVQAHLEEGRIPLSVVESNNPSEWTWIEQYAARASAEYSVTVEGVTYDDWFFPSTDELDFMFENLHMYGLGGFASASFWSSAEHTATSARPQTFPNGTRWNANKSVAYRVRPVRAFK